MCWSTKSVALWDCWSWCSPLNFPSKVLCPIDTNCKIVTQVWFNKTIWNLHTFAVFQNLHKAQRWLERRGQGPSVPLDAPIVYSSLWTSALDRSHKYVRRTRFHCDVVGWPRCCISCALLWQNTQSNSKLEKEPCYFPISSFSST